MTWRQRPAKSSIEDISAEQRGEQARPPKRMEYTAGTYGAQRTSRSRKPPPLPYPYTQVCRYTYTDPCMVPIEERRHGDVTDIHRYAFQGVSPVNDRALRSETFCENSQWGGELPIFSWCRHAQPTQTVADGNDNRGGGRRGVAGLARARTGLQHQTTQPGGGGGARVHTRRPPPPLHLSNVLFTHSPPRHYPAPPPRSE